MGVRVCDEALDDRDGVTTYTIGSSRQQHL